MIRAAIAAHTLADTRAMKVFRDDELTFVERGTEETRLFASAARLAQQARLGGALPEDILYAMRIAGCIRCDEIMTTDEIQASRYWLALSAVLRSYLGTPVAAVHGNRTDGQ